MLTKKLFLILSLPLISGCSLLENRKLSETKAKSDRGIASTISKADVHASDKLWGWTPLHWSAMAGHIEKVESLIEAKADVNARGSLGMTPLHVAAAMGHTASLELLIRAKADVNARTKIGRTPADLARQWKHTEKPRAVNG